MELDHQINPPDRFFFSWFCFCTSKLTLVLCNEINQRKTSGSGGCHETPCQSWLWKVVSRLGGGTSMSQGCWTREGGWRGQSNFSQQRVSHVPRSHNRRALDGARKLGLFISSKVNLRFENKFLSLKKWTPALCQPCALERWRGGSQ